MVKFASNLCCDFTHITTRRFVISKCLIERDSYAFYNYGARITKKHARCEISCLTSQHAQQSNSRLLNHYTLSEYQSSHFTCSSNSPVAALHEQCLSCTVDINNNNTKQYSIARASQQAANN